MTPASVRFLDRKVYLKIVTVLATAMFQGATPQRIAALKPALKIDWHTLKAWRRWWCDIFPSSRQGRILHGRVAADTPEARTVSGLWRQFWKACVDGCTGALNIARFLLFLTPIQNPIDGNFVSNLAAIAFPQKIPKACL
jgi:hypothetical protein